MTTPQLLTQSKSDTVAVLTSSHAQITTALAGDLLRAAIAFKSNAYCPYSNFRVGAAILALPTNPDPEYMNGQSVAKLFIGVNVENAAYPVGTCAERCALGTAVAAGHSRVIAIAVSTDIEPPASPCGMCRQFIREFVVDLNVPIVMMGKKADAVDDAEDACVTIKFGQLLPMSFGPEALPRFPSTSAERGAKETT